MTTNVMKSKNVMSKKREATANKIIAAIKSEKGYLTLAAKKAGLSYVTVWRYAQDFLSVKEAVEEAKETVLDFVEGQLYKKIEDGDVASIIFYLKTKGKSRGYVERQEQQRMDKVTITVRHVDRSQSQ